MTDTVSYADFEELDIRVGKILELKKVEGSDRLTEVLVDVGDEKKTIAWGVGETASDEDLQGLEGTTVVLLSNLEPREIRGVESEGMILEAQHLDDPDEYTPLRVPPSVPVGSRIR